ncbi:MAG: flavodoxin [Blautia massiliensis (ex Durand et al. 2017)]|nr:MAG: flavodoxin [Subdoligranulum variabile]
MSKNVLVAYFSTGGTNKKLAAALAQRIGATLYEIKPKIPYTEKDLNWKNPLSRTMKEYLTKREPEIDGQIHNMDQYGTVILGFPIWFLKEPNIIRSFLKQYDFSGKTIGIFVTSHQSGIEKAEASLQALCPQALWQKGFFANGRTIDELADWATHLEP